MPPDAADINGLLKTAMEVRCASCRKSQGVFLEHGSVLVFCRKCRAISRASCEVLAQPNRKRNVNDFGFDSTGEGQSPVPVPSMKTT